MEPRISIVPLGVDDLQCSFEFYHHHLGFPTSRKPDRGIAFFRTRGTYLALNLRDELAENGSNQAVPAWPRAMGRPSGTSTRGRR